MQDILALATGKKRASIREAECIGCTKCIQACPFDSILGSAKQMHTVIATECTGCELCIAPCPVDCIDLFDIPTELVVNKTQQYQDRYIAHENRLKQEAQKTKSETKQKLNLADKKAYIEAALKRAKQKSC